MAQVVYEVNKLVSDQYGTSEIVGLYASEELAKADADHINKTGGWAMVKPHQVLTQSQFKTASKSASVEVNVDEWLDDYNAIP